MIKKFSYNVNEEMVVKNEKIKGLVLEFGAVKTDGSVCDIADLNRVSIDVFVKRNGGTPKYIYNGYLDNYLTALYAQTVSYELNKKAQGLKYMIKIDFFGTLLLTGNDELVVRMKAQNTTFTSLSTVHADSYINVETIPAMGAPSALHIVSEKGIGNGDTNIDVNVGSNIVKIVGALDFTSDYFTSSKAKFDGIEITGTGLNRNVSQNLLEAENIHYFDNNPESDIAQMVLFWESVPVNNVSVKGKLDKPADADARILCVHRANL